MPSPFQLLPLALLPLSFPRMSEVEQRCSIRRGAPTNRRRLKNRFSVRFAFLILFTVAFAPSPPGLAANATLVPAPGSPFPISATCVAIADFNRDGHKDLLLTVGTHLQTCFGSGTGKFRTTPDRDL